MSHLSLGSCTNYPPPNMAGAGLREKSESLVLVLNWPILKVVLGPGGPGKIEFINRVLLLKGGRDYLYFVWHLANL